MALFEPGRFFRQAISRLPSNFVAVDEAALAAPRQFTSTDHLSTEAVAAYVDGELPMKAKLSRLYCARRSTGRTRRIAPLERSISASAAVPSISELKPRMAGTADVADDR